MKELRIYVDFVEDIEPLADAEVGRLFRAMLSFAADDSFTPDNLKGNERITWATARKNIKNQWAEYRQMCERNKKIATTRYDSLRPDTTKHDSCQENKIKEKKIKDKSIKPPLSPFDGELGEAVNDWLAYKQEKRQPYKPTGLKNLFGQIRNNVESYGEQAVIKVIRDSMSSNYQGIMFDRLHDKKPQQRSRYAGIQDYLNQIRGEENDAGRCVGVLGTDDNALELL